MSWDWVIAVVIIVGLILAIFSRISQQTIGETLTQIKEFVFGTTEELTEEYVPYYE